MTHDELGQYLARELFAFGDMEGRPVTRIQFKSGNPPAGEISLGGLCESSLADFLGHVLSRASSATAP